MNILFILGAIASLAALGSGAHLLRRARADQRRIQLRLRQYTSR